MNLPTLPNNGLTVPLLLSYKVDMSLNKETEPNQTTQGEI